MNSTAMHDARISTRGVKVLNYADDTRFGSEEDEDENGVEPPPPTNGRQDHAAPSYEEQDEIEGVFGHSRDEDKSSSFSVYLRMRAS